MTPQRLVHHELCFGCGRTNLFGLLMDLEQVGDWHVRGRGFVKQDHQGPVPGEAHPGVIAAALAEAMTFAAGGDQHLDSFGLRLEAPVPVGTFVEVEASAAEGETNASASVDGERVATARGAYGQR